MPTRLDECKHRWSRQCRGCRSNLQTSRSQLEENREKSFLCGACIVRVGIGYHERRAAAYYRPGIVFRRDSDCGSADLSGWAISFVSEALQGNTEYLGEEGERTL